MNIGKIKAALALLTGGLAGLIKYVLKVFNEQVLGKIPNKETGAKYLRDAQATYAFLRAIMENHSADLSEDRKEKLNSILSAIEELTKALEDFEVNETELDGIIKKVSDAIDAFKKAKK